jgi:hypothetical protein
MRIDNARDAVFGGMAAVSVSRWVDDGGSRLWCWLDKSVRLGRHLLNRVSPRTSSTAETASQANWSRVRSTYDGSEVKRKLPLHSAGRKECVQSSRGSLLRTMRGISGTVQRACVAAISLGLCGSHVTVIENSGVPGLSSTSVPIGSGPEFRYN